jgi:UDP-N-acetylglucosamine--N-acetylmuramyl-(pentapeptide) pyrophosphoryl-undecaprenol N-acetylglucosamine transferase
MKIVMTGGGSGGHFYPIIAVTEEIQAISRQEKIIDPTIYFMAPEKYNARELFDHEILFVGVPAGKKRVDPKGLSIIKNFFDMFKMGIGVIIAIFRMYLIYPDVVFAKGAYGSFPALFAAKLLRIPVVIHESDSVPGRVNAWAGKFAEKVAVSYKEASVFFDKNKVAYTGNPVRKEIRETLTAGATEYLGLESDVPVILVLAGSQGASVINDSILNALPVLVEKYQIIHQTGKKNFEEVKNTAAVVLGEHKHKNRYKAFDYLNTLALRMSAGASSLVISRGGSTIFEIALWGVPSILVPITISNGDHQRKNSYNYAREGAAIVIEESNLSPEIIINEVDRILGNPKISSHMREQAKKFSRDDSAKLIATEILKIALKHEQN